MPRRKRTGRERTTRQEGTATLSDSFQKLAQDLTQQLAHLQEALHLQEQNAESNLQEALHLQEQNTESRLHEALRLQERRAATALRELEQQLQEKDDDIRTLQQQLQETHERMTVMEERMIFSRASAQYETLQRLHERVEKTETSLRNALETFLPRVESVLSTLEESVLCTRKLSNDSYLSVTSALRSSPNGEGRTAAGSQEELLPPEEPFLSSSNSASNSSKAMPNEEESSGVLEFSTSGLFPASSSSDSSACRTAVTGGEAADILKLSPRGLPRTCCFNSEICACKVMANGEEEVGAQEVLLPPEAPNSSSNSVSNICTVMPSGEETAIVLEQFSYPGLIPLPPTSSPTSDVCASRTAATEEKEAELKLTPTRLPRTSSLSSVACVCTVKNTQGEVTGTQETLLSPQLPYQSSYSTACVCRALPTGEEESGSMEESEPPLMLVALSLTTTASSSSTATANASRETSSGEPAEVLEEPTASGESHAISFFTSSASACHVMSPKWETTDVQEMISPPGVRSPSSCTFIASACKLSPTEEETLGILEELSSPDVSHTSSFPFSASACRSATTGEAAVGAVELPSTRHLEEAADEEEKERERQQVELRVREVTLKMEAARFSPCVLGEQLWMAAGEGRPSEVLRLLDSGAPVNYTGRDGLTPLLRAACLGDNADVVSFLLVRGADCNAVNTYGCSAMHFAVSKDSSGRSVDLLTVAGATINARNKAGVTPLHWAASRNNAPAVRALLVAGARKDLKGWSGGWKNKTPLDLARSAVVRDLLRQRHPV